ncbi:hypothetical protein TPA0907_06940 [Micromonospora humidisoli]|uniref:SRPBCC family protein n=1 Tax=Micromonospora humidisoli TaxID=2807622 RepID=A0ABS2JFN7_9ACTN|nr:MULTISPECIES: SRPBCC family protein [Micromonospora]MBM7084421.1 SRPBCC family protein [Micromonospora humidisoli]GHJ06327.1 hypothetical protein TPA0907_06940 [Micromonospora sp. AKA109]
MDPAPLRPGPPAEVTAVPADGRWTLRFVRELRHPPQRVWAALTDPAQLAGWAPFLADRDLGTPGDVVLTLVDGDTTDAQPATVRRAEAPRLLEHTWGGDLLRWELTPTADGTRLTLWHTVADRGTLPMVAAGWHLCVDVADRLLAGDPVGPVRGRAALDHGWAQLRDAYAHELGDG